MKEVTINIRCSVGNGNARNDSFEIEREEWDRLTDDEKHQLVYQSTIEWFECGWDEPDE